MVHGLGTDPGANPVDVYIREVGTSDFALVIAGEAASLGFGAMQDVGFLPPADYDVLVCNASAGPQETITDCEDDSEGAVNGNSGNQVTVPDTAQVVLFAGYGSRAVGQQCMHVHDRRLVRRRIAAHGPAAARRARSGPISSSVTAGGTRDRRRRGRASQVAQWCRPVATPWTSPTIEGLDIDATIDVAALTEHGDLRDG